MMLDKLLQFLPYKSHASTFKCKTRKCVYYFVDVIPITLIKMSIYRFFRIKIENRSFSNFYSFIIMLLT